MNTSPHALVVPHLAQQLLLFLYFFWNHKRFFIDEPTFASILPLFWVMGKGALSWTNTLFNLASFIFPLTFFVLGLVGRNRCSFLLHQLPQQHILGFVIGLYNYILVRKDM